VRESSQKTANRFSAESVRSIVSVSLLVVMMTSLGCSVQLRLAPEELPENPIAFLHWEDRAGQKRSEAFSKVSEAPPLPLDRNDPERLEQLKKRAYLRGDVILQIQGELAKYPGRLMLIWPRTGEMERIEAAPANSIPLSWSADGKRLLIASGHRGDREQLYEYHVDRKDLRPVTQGPSEHTRGDYDLSGRIYTQRMARTQLKGASQNSIHRVDIAGAVGEILADNVPPGTVRIDASGEHAVYEQVVLRPRSNGPTVFESFIAIQPLIGKGGVPGEERLLLKGREPSLTPDGEWIVFASPSTAGYRLRRMRLDGTSRVPIGPGGTEERMPTVSPDGQFVAFVKFQYGRRRLVVRRFNGKDERILLPSGWTEFPVW
jgi:hypothetical protein